jgi:hypothetical protein
MFYFLDPDLVEAPYPDSEFGSETRQAKMGPTMEKSKK